MMDISFDHKCKSRLEINNEPKEKSDSPDPPATCGHAACQHVCLQFVK